MINAIMAIDDQGGVSKNGSMPWPKNAEDLKYFKKITNNGVVIMGRLTWTDPQMPTPLKNRVNVLVTSKSQKMYPGADKYIFGELNENIKKIINEYKDKNIWIIGGPNLINQVFDLIDLFYITHIKGIYDCDKKINIEKVKKHMRIIQSTPSLDKTCVFNIWKKN